VTTGFAAEVTAEVANVDCAGGDVGELQDTRTVRRVKRAVSRVIEPPLVEQENNDD
jgi:hypothetical protein